MRCAELGASTDTQHSKELAVHAYPTMRHDCLQHMHVTGRDGMILDGETLRATHYTVEVPASTQA